MRSSKIVNIIAVFVCLSFVGVVTLAAPAKTSTAPKKAKNLTTDLLKVDNTSKTDLEKYKNQLEALKMILNGEKNEVKRYDLFMRKASIHLLIAQNIGFNRTDKAKMTTEEKLHLSEAEKILSTYEPRLKNSKRHLAAIYYMRGMIHYEYNRSKEMLEAFRQSINLDLNNKRVPGLALIIAEHLYESDNYNEAIKYYTAFQNKMSPYQRDLANYKIAWSYIGLGNYDKGFEMFLKLIRSNAKNSFSNDSIKDLSYFMAQTKNEDEIIQAAELYMPDLEIRSKFYISVIESFMAIDRKDKVSALFAEALKIQKTSVDKLKTRLYKLLFSRREYPTYGEWELILSLNEEIKLVSPEDREKFFFTFGADLEAVLEHYIKNVLDIYSSKIQVKNGVKKENSFNILNDVINIFLNLFPKSPKTITMWNILVDLCKESSQIKCLNELAQKSDDLSKTNEQYKQVYRKILLSKLVIWEAAYDKADKNAKDNKNSEQASKGFIDDAENFLNQFPTAPENLKIRKKLVSVYLQNKNTSKALSHVEKNIQAEPSVDNYKALLLIYFEKGDYTKIIDLKDKIKSLNSRETDEILRETYIKLAEEHKKDDDFKDYVQTITSYLEMQKDPAKRSIVILDVMYTALKKEDMTVFIQFWELLPKDSQKSSAVAAIKTDAINYMIQSGDFRELKGFEVSKPIKFPEAVYKAANKMSFSQDQWDSIKRMKLDDRLYFYSTFMLESPLTVIYKLKDTNNSKEKKILEISRALHSGVLAKEKKVTGPRSKNMAKYKTIAWPSEKLSVEKYSARAERAVGDVRTLRKKSVAELQQLQLPEKLELLKVMAIAEKRCSEMLTTSPYPVGLTPEQIEEYKKGLTELAVEFDTQHAEFTKLAEEVLKKMDEVAKAESDKILPEFNSLKWPWPGSDISDKAQALADKKSLFAALVYLDRQLENKKIDNSNYVAIKAGLVAKVNRTEAGREFVRQEIVAANRNDLLEVWKGFAK